MRALLFLLLTSIPIIGMSQLPPEDEILEELARTEETYRAEVIASWSTTSTTSSSSTTTTVNSQTVNVETAPPATLPGISTARCGAWWETAVAMGWDPALLPVLDEVMWRESRCTPDATNGADHGLVQVNWKTWSGLVESLGHDKQALYVPAVNLLIGRLIYEEALARGYRCPWSPWSSSGDYC